MAQYAFRAVLADGSLSAGLLEASDTAAAVASLRKSGARPIAVAPAPIAGKARLSQKSRTAAINLTGELAVLLNAGLPLDRAMSLALANIEDKPLAGQFAEMLAEVREGSTLSQSMAKRAAIFPPAAAAMAEAGEANGALGAALTRLAAMLENSEELRRLVRHSTTYPKALGLIAVGVILMMLLFVVPQFESLFAQAQGDLPAASLFVMGASQTLREWGWLLLGMIVAAVVSVRHIVSRPSVRAMLDRAVLVVPQLGMLVRCIETARFARTLGVLIEGNVSLPYALALARRTVGNGYIGGAIAKVADGVREGGGLATPLAAAGVLPRIAIGFLRTGEETSQLGPMLARLADVLDRDVKFRIQRLIGVLTPIITIILGASVAAIIAAIMSAIIGFNDLAIAQ